MDKIKVMIVDDHDMVRKGLKAYLASEQTIEVVGEAKSGHQALAIYKAHCGTNVIDGKVAQKLVAGVRHTLHDQLTSREREVLQLIAEGKNNAQIAETLFIGIKTVKTHVSSIFSKLEVTDRTQAAVYAFQHHLFD